ncbi:MAG: cytochrome c biogenesis protein CcsA, partial [Chlamydiia bacterium]|nr:cytochrome c biogenesis protein CcsA [Chlamydiia bacterium]
MIQIVLMTLLAVIPVLEQGRVQPLQEPLEWQMVDEQPWLELFQRLAEQGYSGNELARELERRMPLKQRLRSVSGPKVLAGKWSDGEWFAVSGVKLHLYDPIKGGVVPVPNFTQLSDHDFARLQGGDFTVLEADEGHWRLVLEQIYRSFPWVTVCVGFFFLGIWWRGGFFVGWALLTAVLAARCAILQRPPVSNMEETLLFVPWVACPLSLPFTRFGSALATGLLGVSLLAFPVSSLEVVQPVLNSPFWLTIHVLMVVGSYGVFALASLFAHVWLIQPRDRLQQAIVRMLSIGVTLLIVGTILGGVWAAESWGRFWDWDPKESWAFISSSLYLLFIHAWRCKKIGPHGLALGAIMGFLAISFTWYGVNYILGTGLHSYGFGSGGIVYYILFISLETLFITYK